MKKMKGTWLRLAVLCLVLCLCVSVAACGGQGNTKPTGGASDMQQPITYTVEVRTQGGSVLSDVTVFVYADDTLADLIAVAKTDKDGKAQFTYAAGDGYVAVLTDVPQGYTVEQTYPITGEVTTLTLTAELIEGDLSSVTYKLGDVMQDFTFAATDGTEYKLSQLLQEKKAVVLNFWFLSCNPCKQEFPYLQEAYEAYQDEIALLAIDPVDTDNAQVTAFAEELGLTFPMGTGDPAWETAMKVTAYPTTVVIDRFGTIALIHSGTIPDAQKFKDIFAFFADEEYVQTAVEDVQSLFVTEPEADAVENPVDISGQNSFQLTIQPGKIHYVNVHKMQNVWLQVNNSDIYVEYGGKKFTASNGSIGLLISAPSTFEPANVGFGNSGEKAQTFTVTLSNLAGSYENPYKLQLGEFTANEAAGNDQGVYFSYTAQQDGQFSLECLSVSPSVEYDFSVMNLSTSVMRNYASEGQVNSETGRKAVVMLMNQGDKLRITIGTLPDESNNYPAATFKMLAGFSAGEVEDVVQVEKAAYAVTVTDENRNPVAGVGVNLSGKSGDRASAVTDEKGVASLWIPKDAYTGAIVVPKGYEANTMQFDLTPESPFVSLKLDTVIPEETADYTVRITDENGKAMSNVVVVVGSIFGTTDTNGSYTATLPKGTYKVMVVVPSGYTSNSFAYTFPENDTTLAITLRKLAEGESSTGGNIGGGSSGGSSGGSDEPTGTPYTVQLVNVIGGAVTDAVVTIYDATGIPVSISTVNSAGKMTAYLDPGNYTVGIVSGSGATLTYNQQDAVLSADKTAVTIQVAAVVGNAELDSEQFLGNFYNIYSGSTLVNFTKNTNKSPHEELNGNWMYMFYPASSGIYRFTISQGAILTSYGTVVLNRIEDTATDGYFDMEVKESEFANEHQPVIFLGVQPDAGVTDAYITISRIGDSEEMGSILYTPVTAPAKFTLAESGTITYVDLQGTANIVKKNDGYYLNGKKLYVNIGKGAPCITMSTMLGLSYNSQTNTWTAGSMGTGLKGALYEEDKMVAVEDFTQCMRDYINCCDPSNGLYPLNDDLIYMFQNAGAYMGWWNSKSPNYQFANLSSLNVDIAWMFACCYVS